VNTDMMLERWLDVITADDAREINSNYDGGRFSRYNRDVQVAALKGKTHTTLFIHKEYIVEMSVEFEKLGFLTAIEDIHLHVSWSEK